MSPLRRGALTVGLTVLAAVCVWQLRSQEAGITQESLRFGDTPATVYRGPSAGPAPLVVVAHGFAGSRRLMEPLALALAGSGYVAVTFDFLGHGEHPEPLRGDLMSQDGTPALLMDQTGQVVEAALELPGVDGRLALAGHSMATNILVRYAQSDPRVSATVGISMFAPTIDSTSPPNLLAVVGAWEGRLEREGRRVVAMVTQGGPGTVEPFTTYGRWDQGTARRLAVAPRVEHVGVLYSATTVDETVAWMDETFERAGAGGEARRGGEAERVHGRGLWILALMTLVFVLARPLASGLPRLRDHPVGTNSPWRRLLLVAGVPAVATPLLLSVLPTSFLPVVVGDYLAVHFFLFGLLSGGLLWWTGDRPDVPSVLEAVGLRGGDGLRTVGTAALMVGFFLLLVAWPLDRFFTSFVPVPERLPLLLAILVGTLPYFLVDEWLTRGAEARRGAYPLTKLLFLVSLGIAVALDFEGLFFLILIVPFVLAFFLVHGLFSRWVYRSTGSPTVAALGNAVAFAWALSVTFPLYAGP